MPSDLERAIARQRAALLAGERAAAAEVVRVYGAIWQRIQGDLAAIVPGLDGLTLAQVQRDARLRALRTQVEVELRRFGAVAAQNATAQQAQAAALAAEHAVENMRWAGAVRSTFNRLPTTAIESLVGIASDGSPLRTLFDEIGPGVAEGATDALAEGLALGQSPHVTARRVRSALGVGLSRALTITRTEVLRAYREATALTFERNADIVEGWVWVSACNRRSCGSCVALHGSFHPLSERLQSHPNCRCVAAPSIRGRASRIVPAGAERFERLSEADQRHILGPGMYEAWQEGRVELVPDGPLSIVAVRESPRWGVTRTPRPLRTIR